MEMQLRVGRKQGNENPAVDEFKEWDDLVEKNEHPDHRDVRRVVEDPVRNHVAHKRVAKNAGKVLSQINLVVFDPTSIFNEGRPKVK